MTHLNQVAHVIVVSDNRENAKQLARALPSKPLNIIALADADKASALSLVKEKLHTANVDVDFGREETEYVERLGGRAEDLESVSETTIPNCMILNTLFRSWSTKFETA